MATDGDSREGVESAVAVVDVGSSVSAAAGAAFGLCVAMLLGG